MIRIVFIALLFCHLMLCSVGQIVNIEERRSVNDTALFSGQLGLALSYTKTTTELLQGSGDLRIIYAPAKNNISFFSQFNQVSADEKDYLNNAFFHIRHNYSLTDKITSELFLQYQYDKQKKISSRFLAGAGPRFEIINNDNISLYAASLVMYQDETLTDNSRNTEVRISAYISFQMKVNDILSFRHITYFQPLITGFGDYRLATEDWIEVTLTDAFSLKITSDINYDTDPAQGVPNLFYLTKTGAVYKF